jgi:UrcA family protein
MTRTFSCLVAAFALLAPLASAGAQAPDQDITVTGAHERLVGRNPMTGGPIFEYDVSVTVATGDLDLRDSGDWRLLEGRVWLAARRGCAWLETRYGLPRDRECAWIAGRQGMAQARRIAAGSNRVASLRIGIGAASGL